MRKLDYCSSAGNNKHREPAYNNAMHLCLFQLLYFNLLLLSKLFISNCLATYMVPHFFSHYRLRVNLINLFFIF